MDKYNKAKLLYYRLCRNFLPQKYCDAKGIILNNYLKTHNINTVMVALSGGIDSAVVLGLLVHASAMPGSPIKSVVGINLPIFSKGVSCNQEATFDKSMELKTRFPTIVFKSVDVSKEFNSMVNTIADTMDITSSNWSSGQLVSNIRIPAMYFVNALLFKNEQNAVVCGTINRDEGGYVGYFGKASDAVADLQLISDIHKSEVYMLAEFMKIPKSIVEAKPHGDVYNGLCDEELLGVTYDFMELYAAYLCKDIIPVETENWVRDAAKMEYHHKKCIHKYYMPGMAVNIDVYDHTIPNKPVSLPLTMDTFSRFINCKNLRFQAEHSINAVTTLKTEDKTVVANLLSTTEVDTLVALAKDQDWIFTDNHGTPVADKSGPGSYRISWHNQIFADELFHRIKLATDILVTDGLGDYDGCKVWRPIGINPYFRFIRYLDKDNLVPHYDSPTVFNDTTKTLRSVVIYLTTNKTGQTCFIKEREQADYKDWAMSETQTDILETIPCVKGSALVFNHRLLHSSHQIEDEEKIIIRTDIIYEKCYTRSATYSTEPLGLVSVKQSEYDEYYGAASKKYSKMELVEAGWMDVRRKELPLHFNFLGTPYHKIRQTKKKPVLLVTSGCFNPIHAGHILMLEKAKLSIEEDCEVIGGYFVIANEHYQEKKLNKKISIVDIIKAAEERVRDHEWLMIDPYEALYEKHDINFTDTIDRLQKYTNTDVRYVFGGDNAKFARTFIGKGKCICVARPGYQEIFNKIRAEVVSERISFIDTYTENISSTLIRKQSVDSFVQPLSGKYIVNEDAACEQNIAFPQTVLREFNHEVVELLKRFIDPSIIVVNTYSPKTKESQTTDNEISLCSYYRTSINLNVSTLYANACYKTKIGLIARPGCDQTIEEQINTIPNGDYMLVDDDTYSGYTVKTMKTKLIKQGLTILGTYFMNQSIKENTVLDILDCRDLLIGRENAGSVVRLLSGKVCRVPYILPYCYPSAKCSIPTKDDLAFSVEVWKMNYDFFKISGLTVRDVDVSCQTLLLEVGFVLDHPMSYICKAHIMYLSE
jgi:NAD+ synthetase